MLFVVNREPEVTAALIDQEVAGLLEFIDVERRDSSVSGVDVGRSVFYMLAIDEYTEHIRTLPQTSEIIAAERAKRIAELEDPDFDPSKYGYPLAEFPPAEDRVGLLIDDERSRNVLGIAIIQNVTAAKALKDSAVHYFQSRPLNG